MIQALYSEFQTKDEAYLGFRLWSRLQGSNFTRKALFHLNYPHFVTYMCIIRCGCREDTPARLSKHFLKMNGFLQLIDIIQPGTSPLLNAINAWLLPSPWFTFKPEEVQCCSCASMGRTLRPLIIRSYATTKDSDECGHILEVVTHNRSSLTVSVTVIMIAIYIALFLLWTQRRFTTVHVSQ